MVVYLPWPQMHPRYVLPGIWGLDLLLAVVLTIGLRTGGWGRVVLLLVVLLGLGKLARDTVREQLTLAQRLQPTWQALVRLESAAVPAQLSLIVSESEGFHDGEIIHFGNHVLFRRRADLAVTALPAHATAATEYVLSRSSEPPAGSYRLVERFGSASRKGHAVFLWRRSVSGD
jgi:hypothetical protein